MKFKTKQEFFWKGKFGDQYIKRNNAKSLLVAHKKFFKKINGTPPPHPPNTTLYKNKPDCLHLNRMLLWV